MAGINDYKRWINILTTTEDIRHVFPIDQYKLTYNIEELGADGWTANIEWSTLIVDKVVWTGKPDKIPDFSNSTCIGYYPSGSASQGSSGTITLPANMYTGRIYPAGDTYIPVTVVQITWTKDTRQVQRQVLLIQNWCPGVKLGDPTMDDGYEGIVNLDSNFVLSKYDPYVLFGEYHDFLAETDIPIDLGPDAEVKLYKVSTSTSTVVAIGTFTESKIAPISVKTDYGPSDSRTIGVGTYTVYATFPGRRDYGFKTSNTLTMVIKQGIPLTPILTFNPQPAIYNQNLKITTTAYPDPSYEPTGLPISNTLTYTLTSNSLYPALSGSIIGGGNLSNGVNTQTVAMTSTWIESTILTGTNYTVISSTSSAAAYTATVEISRTHTIGVEGKYDRANRYNSFFTTTNFTVTNTVTITKIQNTSTIHPLYSEVNLSNPSSGPIKYVNKGSTASLALVGDYTSPDISGGTTTFKAYYTSTVLDLPGATVDRSYPYVEPMPSNVNVLARSNLLGNDFYIGKCFGVARIGGQFYYNGVLVTITEISESGFNTDYSGTLPYNSPCVLNITYPATTSTFNAVNFVSTSSYQGKDITSWWPNRTIVLDTVNSIFEMDTLSSFYVRPGATFTLTNTTTVYTVLGVTKFGEFTGNGPNPWDLNSDNLDWYSWVSPNFSPIVLVVDNDLPATTSTSFPMNIPFTNPSPVYPLDHFISYAGNTGERSFQAYYIRNSVRSEEGLYPQIGDVVHFGSVKGTAVITGTNYVNGTWDIYTDKKVNSIIEPLGRQVLIRRPKNNLVTPTSSLTLPVGGTPTTIGTSTFANKTTYSISTLTTTSLNTGTYYVYGEFSGNMGTNLSENYYAASTSTGSMQIFVIR